MMANGGRDIASSAAPNKSHRTSAEADGSSPTSIVTVSLRTPPLRRLRSVIAVRDDGGTEVTLGSEGKVTPTFHGKHHQTTLEYQHDSPGTPVTPDPFPTFLRPMNALLDSEITPSPLQGPSRRPFDEIVWDITSSPDDASPQKLPFCGMIGGECYGDDGVPLSALEMQQKISQFLGVPLSALEMQQKISQGWQAWSYFNTNSDRDQTKPASRDSNEQERNDQIKRVFQNRAFDMSARKARLQVLQRDLSPFNATPPNQSVDTRPRSFNTTPRKLKKPAHVPPPADSKKYKNVVTPEKELPLWQCGMQCGLDGQEEDSPIFPRRTDILDDNNDVCYDSDPENFRRPLPTEKLNMNKKSENGSNKENTPPNLIIADDDCILRNDDDLEVKVMVQEIMNERITLILHQNSKSSSQSQALRPRGVYFWVERGQNLKDTVILPRFVWTPISSISSSSTSSSRRKTISQRQDLSSISLLDIHRILEVEKLDRMAHPFAKKRNTFILQTLDRTVMFETCSASERDRLVQALKMAVARFGSMLLLKEDGLVDEFFAGGNDDPGKEVYWLNDTV